MVLTNVDGEGNAGVINICGKGKLQLRLSFFYVCVVMAKRKLHKYREIAHDKFHEFKKKKCLVCGLLETAHYVAGFYKYSTFDTLKGERTLIEPECVSSSIQSTFFLLSFFELEKFRQDEIIQHYWKKWRMSDYESTVVFADGSKNELSSLFQNAFHTSNLLFNNYRFESVEKELKFFGYFAGMYHLDWKIFYL